MEREHSLSAKAYRQIKSMILHLELKPGERIPEEKIAGHTGGSRTPVREALRQLSNEGLVNIYPRRFAEVANYDSHEIKQIGAVRLSQDLLACNLAIKYASDADFRNLELLAAQCEQGAESGNIYDRITYDLEFHAHIAEIGKNQLLIQNVRKTYLMVHLLQISKYTTVADSLLQIRHHWQIIHGMQNRDYPFVSHTICEHLRGFFDLDQDVVDMYLTPKS